MELQNKFNEILNELRSIKRFPKKTPSKDKTRSNILREGVESIETFSIGLARAYHLKEMVNCAKNKRFPKLLELIKEAIALFDPDFNFTTITIGKNIQTKRHKDKNNVGMSLALALGDFTGGGIIQYNTDGTSSFIDTKDKFQYQDGSLPHETAPFIGERYALIIYYHKAGFNSPNSPPLEKLINRKMEILQLEERVPFPCV